jgi:hypothetical protein
MFYQGRVPTKALAKRCPHCQEYIGYHNGVKMSYHLREFCTKHPESSNYEQSD